MIHVDTDLAAALVPYIAGAVGAYGTAVIEKVREEVADATADATVGAGRRILRRVLQRDDSAASVTEAVEDLAQDPTDEDRVAALRLQLRKAVAADAKLAGDLTALLPNGTVVTATGMRSVAAGEIPGIVQTGDGSAAWQGRA